MMKGLLIDLRLESEKKNKAIRRKKPARRLDDNGESKQSEEF